jgi:hypothetical protein
MLEIQVPMSLAHGAKMEVASNAVLRTAPALMAEVRIATPVVHFSESKITELRRVTRLDVGSSNQQDLSTIDYGKEAQLLSGAL